MRIKNEILLIIFILIFIMAFEMIIRNIANTTVAKFTNEQNAIMEKIYESLKNENKAYEKEALSEEIKNMKEEWFESRNKMSIFSEHNELEKVTRAIIVFEENVKNGEYKTALENRSRT